MRRLFPFIPLILFFNYSLYSQDTLYLQLQDAIQIAQEESLPAVQARNRYLTSYWRFKSFEAELKPYVDLSTTPFNYNRSVVERYDSDLNRDVFRSLETINNSLNLSVNKQLGITGGTIFLDTELARLQTFGDNTFTNYFSTPIRIGFSQELGGFNEYKWKKQLEPLQFEKAKQQYNLELELIALRATELFFALHTAQLNFNISSFNLSQADTLLSISQERFKLGTITQDDLLELEMNRLQAFQEVRKVLLDVKEANYSLSNLMGSIDSVTILPVIPTSIPNIEVDPTLALILTQKYHPDWLNFSKQLIEAQQEMDRVNKENNLQASLTASFGLNQQSNDFAQAYNFPLEQQQRVLLSLNIPVLDWGRRKGQKAMARSNQELINAEIEQEQLDLSQRVSIQALKFRLQPSIIDQAKKSEQLAEKRYSITKKRFLLGSVDLLKLTSSLSARNQARKEAQQAQKDFWESYYTLRSQTLFDFEQNTPITYEILAP